MKPTVFAVNRKLTAKELRSVNFELERFVRVLGGWTDFAIREGVVTIKEVRDQALRLADRLDEKASSRRGKKP